MRGCAINLISSLLKRIAADEARGERHEQRGPAVFVGADEAFQNKRMSVGADAVLGDGALNDSVAPGDELMRDPHHAVPTAKKEESMQSQGERIGWLEADLRTLTARVDEIGRATRDLHWAESGANKAAEELSDDLRKQAADLRADIDNIHSRINRVNEVLLEVAQVAGQRMDRLLIGLLALGAVSFVEAIAIIVLWGRR